MTRYVKKTANSPLIIEGKENKIAICMCGLSKNQPYCDGSHHKTADEVEKKIYIYEE